MPDIFDQIADQAPKGDIFDQVAAGPQRTMVRYMSPGQGVQQFEKGSPDEAQFKSRFPNAQQIPVPAGAGGKTASSYNVPRLTSPEQQQQYDAQSANVSKVAREALPWAAGAAAVPLTGGTSLIPSAIAAGGGGVLGSLAQQGLEKMAGTRQQMSGGQALTKGAEVGGTELAFGAANKYVAEPLVGAASKYIAKLYGESPARIAELQSLFPKEKMLQQAVNDTEEASRAGFKNAYDSMKIDAAPVNVAGTKNLAQQAIKEINPMAPVPAPLSRVAAIPEPNPAMLPELPKVNPAMSAGDLPTTGTMDDPNEILKQIAAYDQIPFRQAQQFRQGIESYISKSKPPANVYNALKKVSGALTNGLKTTAETEAKLTEFNTAEAMYKQHAADFWNKGAPLKDYLPINKGGKVVPGQEGQTLNRLTQTANQSRALDALERRNVPIKDIQAVLSRGSSAVKRDIQDAVTLKNFGRQSIDQAVSGPARDKLAKSIKWASGLGVTGGGLTALVEHLSKPKQSVNQ